MRKVSSRRGASRAPASVVAEADIVALGHAGDGVARVNGREVFVPYALPGEHARLSITGERGEIAALLRESPDRTAPVCPYFGTCGGCVAQHVAPHAYRAWKRGLVVTALAQRGFADAPVSELVSVAPGTRRRVLLAFSHAARATRLGFHRRHAHELVDIAACPVACPEISAALPRIKEALARHLPASCRGTLHLTWTESGLDANLAFDTAPDAPELVLRESLAAMAHSLDLARLSLAGEPVAVARSPVLRFDGVPVTLPPGSFLQPSAEGEAHMIAWVDEALAPARRVVDLFAGLGTLSLPLARTRSVHAVDVAGDALDVLTQAARASGRRVTTERRDLARAPLGAEALVRFDGAVFDPPRAGAAAQAERLAEARLPRIVAVSCNPATFARDARLIVDRGYTLAWVRPLDQFLWSAHLEIVALFLREGA